MVMVIMINFSELVEVMKNGDMRVLNNELREMNEN